MRGKSLWLVAVVAIIWMTAAVPDAAAKRLADSFIRIEINATDGDAGIHIFLDGEGWDSMQCIGPDGSVLFSFLAEGSVGIQGITEFFFESAEPSFDEQPLDELLELFPEGRYRFRGSTTEGRRLNGRAILTHALPDGPIQISPIDGEGVDPEDAVFEWDLVADPSGSEIVGYEIVVSCEGDFVEFSAQVGPEVTSVTVPPEVLSQEGAQECKWEVLAIEESGNQTISEAEFAFD